MRTARMHPVALLLTSLMLFPLLASGQEKPVAPAGTPRYKDASLPIQDRVADLLPRMTLEEKVEQISGGWENRIEVIDPTGTFTNEKARKVINNDGAPETQAHAAAVGDSAQRRAALSAREDAAGDPGPVPGRGAARLYGIRQHQLSAGAGPGQHVWTRRW